MPLVDYCIRDAILCNMEVGDKEDALRQLVDALGHSGAIPKGKMTTIRKEVIERERQATTGIGNGVGVPHTRTDHAKNLSLAIGRVPEGIEYGAVDGERVRVMLLLVSPKDATEEHLAVIKAIVKIVRDPYQCKRLHGCSSIESFLDLIAEVDGPAQ